MLSFEEFECSFLLYPSFFCEEVNNEYLLPKNEKNRLPLRKSGLKFDESDVNPTLDSDPKFNVDFEFKVYFELKATGKLYFLF